MLIEVLHEHDPLGHGKGLQGLRSVSEVENIALGEEVADRYLDQWREGRDLATARVKRLHSERRGQNEMIPQRKRLRAPGF